MRDECGSAVRSVHSAFIACQCILSLPRYGSLRSICVRRAAWLPDSRRSLTLSSTLHHRAPAAVGHSSISLSLSASVL